MTLQERKAREAHARKLVEIAHWRQQAMSAQVTLGVAEQLLTRAPADSRWARAFQQRIFQAAHAFDRCSLFAETARFRA